MERGRAARWSAGLAATVSVALCGCTSGPHDSPFPAARATTAQSSRPTGPPSVTVSGSGDILLHSPLWAEAAAYAKAAGGTGYDFDPMFAQVKGAISAADIAICHQETPISSTDTDLSPPGSTTFNVPREIAGSLKRAGYDGCDAASNHTMDRGLAGIVSTRRQLQAAGLKVAGPTGAPGPLGIPAMYEAKGIKVADLAFTYTLPNSATPTTHVPSNAPWLKAYLWPAIGASAIIADARAAKRAGADIVIVNIHWGKEGVQHPTADQTALAARLLASPYVDAIFGTHAHVVQPCTTIHGKYVFYGLGNFISNQGPTRGGGQTDSNQDGVLARITFSKTGSDTWSQRASYQPTYVDDAARHTIRLATPQSDPASWGRTKRAMNALGSCPAVAAGS